MYTLKWEKFKYSSEQFGLWRILFGLYLVYYYFGLLPYGTELFSRDGFVADFVLGNRTLFPEFMLNWDSATQVQIMIGLCGLFSILITLGYFRKVAAFGLWLLTMWFYNRNPYTNSPEYSFINWLIFACMFIPTGEAFSIGKKDPNWKMPKYFYWGAWILLVVGYGYSGSAKFKAMDENWLNGTAMYYVLVTDNARLHWYGQLFDAIPKVFFIPVSWGALACQTFAPVFAYFRKLRPWWWLISTLVHIGLLLLVNVAQVSSGMIIFHLFVFDSRWIRGLKFIKKGYLEKIVLLRPRPGLTTN